ncbi:hydroxysteroid 11-beta-dehydrogenase 1-like protein isoform X10 [Hylobates moloch]|uniref:hydroxysteroid 11-beta-dehydrogenase 1-like protein isoform X10 n=1 Tax=Hylobates moloch TaxID=81572 RepID=UPI001363B3C7|nr:hydroxysteroid 11-beta-dehydrogenase 1-like protein isoform X10 [Hylobates moloch]XP_055105870.1 hydroxysteroid 11-beta-dehydrogenase 1-like protein isoform X9 [Symphalangus syndactylus]
MDPRRWHHQTPTKHGWLWARPVLATSVPCPSAGPQRTMKVLLLTGLGALFFAYYWDDNFDPGGLDYLVLNHIGGAPAGTRARSPQATRWLMQVNFLSYVQLTSRALPSLTDSKGSLVVVSSLLGRVPTSFSTPYSAAKFALDGFFGSLRRELDVQDVNVAITMCVLGLRDRASAAEAVRGVTRVKAAPGPKAALAVIRGGATRAAGVFYPWRFHLLCLLRRWLPRPRAWFIRQELNVTAAAAA